MSGVVHPRHGGDNAESATIQTYPQLQFVGDSEAEHYDAEVVEPITVGDARMTGACQLDIGTPVEIKSAMVVLSNGQSGRFYLRKQQHDRLVGEDAWYCFVVCEPRPQRELLAAKFVPAREVGEIVPSWRDAEGRATFAQISWGRIIDPSEVRG